MRNETLNLDIDTYSGILISKKALHEDTLKKTITDDQGNKTLEEKKVLGVYVLRGRELVFKQIVPLFENNNYVVCNTEPDEDKLFLDKTVEVYDEVVVEGTNLYNGKIIK